MTEYKLEGDLQRAIQIEGAKHGVKLHRNNSGVGWVGKIIHHTAVLLTMTYPKPLYAGLGVGSSDLIGWDNRGRFWAVEVKQVGKKPTAVQRDFLDAVTRDNGIAVWVDSMDKFKVVLTQQGL